MGAGLLGLIEPRGWGLLALVVLVVLSNPSLVSEIAGLSRRLSRPKGPGDTQYWGFELYRLDRIRPGTGMVKWLRRLSTAGCIILIAGFFFILYLRSTEPPEEGIVNSLLTLLTIVLFFFVPIVVIIDNHKGIRSSVTLELSGDYETLLRFCLRLMFDARATITGFDAAAGQIEAGLYGREITIKLEAQRDSRNELTLTSTGRLINTLLHAVEYRRSIDELVRSLCSRQKDS